MKIVFSRSVMPTFPFTSKFVTPPSPILSLNHQLEIVAIREQFASDYFIYDVPTLAENNKPSIPR